MITNQALRRLSIDSCTVEDLSITRAIKPYLDFLNGSPFIGITYTGKKTKETARYRLQVGADYLGVVRNWITDLEIMRPELRDVDLEAADALIKSFNKTLAGKQDGNTRAGQYVNIAPGLKVNLNDGTCELQGIQRSRTILIAGTYKEVNSADLTIAKNKLQSKLTKWRSFALDEGYFHGIRIQGDELVFGAVN